MPTLYLLRHGNASLGGAAQSDHDRALNQVGERAALLMGAYLAQLSVRLDLVLCSSALRTRQTWELVASRLPDSPEAQFERSLYLCGAQAIRQRIHDLPRPADSVMIIAHNPDLQDVALAYSGIADSGLMAKLRRDYPPAGLAALQFDRPWAELGLRAGRLQWYVVPRDLI